MMEKLKGIISFCAGLFPSVRIINFLIEQNNQRQCLKYTTVSQNVKFYKEAIISNEQLDKSKIIIGAGTHIAGTLLVFGYGGMIEIGENCYVGDHSRIWSGENIKTGNNVLISHGVNIMDTNAHEIDHFLRADGYINIFSKGTKYLANRVITQKVFIGDYSWIGFNSIILKGVTIGKVAIIAAGSVVTKNVAPFTLVAGNPAKLIKHLQEN